MRVKNAHPHGTQVVPAISQEPWEPGDVREVDPELGQSLVDGGDYTEVKQHKSAKADGEES